MGDQAEVDLFLAHLVGLDRDPATIDHYRVSLRQFFTWFTETTGQAAAAAITPLDLRLYRQSLEAARLKPATINKKLSDLTGFLGWCLASGRIASNPMVNVKRVKMAPRAPKWLTRVEVYAVLRTAQQAYQLAQVNRLTQRQAVTARTLAIVTLLLNTGLRVSELCALHLEDLRISERSGLVVVQRGKGGKYREVPLNNDARKAVKTWLKLREDNGPYLFHLDGQPLDRRLINYHLSKLGQAAKVRLTPHLLRHTFGKNLVDAGEPLNRVAILMGHDSLDTTAIYTLPSLSELSQAVEKITWSD